MACGRSLAEDLSGAREHPRKEPHTRMSFHDARFLRGDPPISRESRWLHTERGADAIEASGAKSIPESQTRAVPAGREAGVGPEPGGRSGSRRPGAGSRAGLGA